MSAGINKPGQTKRVKMAFRLPGSKIWAKLWPQIDSIICGKCLPRNEKSEIKISMKYEKGSRWLIKPGIL